MQIQRISWFSKTIVVAALVWVSSSVTAQASILYQVTVNTSTLSGTNGNIDFQFNPGGATSQAALVAISSFTGAVINGTAFTTGGVSGNLPSTVTINNSTAFNDYFQALTFGPSLSFLLQFNGPAVNSPNGTATSGSAFGLSLYNAAGDTPLLTTNPDGFIGTANVNLNGTVTTTTYPSNGTGGAPVATFTVVSSVPEPGTFVLLGASFLSIGFFRRRLVQSRRNP